MTPASKRTQRHMDCCDACRTFAQRQEQLAEQLHTAPDGNEWPRVSDELHAKIMARFARSSADDAPVATVRVISPWISLAVAASVLLAIGLGFWFVSGRIPPVHNADPLPSPQAADASSVQWLLNVDLPEQPAGEILMEAMRYPVREDLAEIQSTGQTTVELVRAYVPIRFDELAAVYGVEE